MPAVDSIYKILLENRAAMETPAHTHMFA